MSRSATYFFLTIENEKLVVKFDGSNNGETTRVIDSVTDYNDFFRSKADEAGLHVGQLQIMASSSVDFPDEYTKDADVIELAGTIRKES